MENSTLQRVQDLANSKQEEQAIQNEILRVTKMVNRIKRKHKLYFRTATGEIRRLDKTANTLYELIMILLLKQDGEVQYSKVNDEAKHWIELKPIDLTIDKKYESSFKQLQRAIGAGFGVETVVITYNGSWKPLVRISMELAQ